MGLRSFTTAAWLGAAGSLLMGCGGPPEPAASPHAAPSPSTVSKDNPGGDADDPDKAALMRLLSEPLGTLTDKFETIRARFPDWANWRRVRFVGYPVRSGFRYGDQHYAIDAIIYSQGQPGDTPETCLGRFVDKARAIGKNFNLELGPVTNEVGTCYPRDSVLTPRPKPPKAPESARPSQKQLSMPMPAIRTEASFVTVLASGHWFAAAVAYPTWPGTCLVQGFAVDGADHPDLAEAVVSRWLREGAGRLIWERALWEAPPVEDR
jgi:hypothetical protein